MSRSTCGAAAAIVGTIMAGEDRVGIGVAMLGVGALAGVAAGAGAAGVTTVGIMDGVEELS